MGCFMVMTLWIRLLFAFNFNQDKSGGVVQDFLSSSRSGFRTPSSDSLTATVIALALGYPLEKHQLFVGSLRHSGFQGNILLITEPPAEMDEYVLEYLEKKDVQLKFVKMAEKCTTPFQVFEPIPSWDSGDDPDIVPKCLEPYPQFKVQLGRFPLMKEFLEECATCTGPVLSTDFADVIFQQDPFDYPDYIPPEGLQVFEESASTYYSSWLYDIPLSNCKGRKLWKPRVSPGQTVGTREKILEYYNVMYETMKEWIKDDKIPCPLFNGNDHAIHQTLFYEDKLPKPIRAFRNRDGMVNNVGATGKMIMFEERKRYVLANHLKVRGFEEVIKPPDDDDDEMVEKQTIKRKQKQKEYEEMPYHQVEDLEFVLMGASCWECNNQEQWIGPHYELTDYAGYFINLDGLRSPVVHQYDTLSPNVDWWIEYREEYLYKNDWDLEFEKRIKEDKKRK